MSKNYNYDTPREWFRPTSYQTFLDWFSRTLDPNTLALCEATSAGSFVCSPAEAVVRYHGQVQDGLIEVKEGKANLLKALRTFPETSANLGKYEYVKISLRKAYYHRLHSPIEGRVLAVRQYAATDTPFGKNSATLFSFDTERGVVFMAALGERDTGL